MTDPAHRHQRVAVERQSWRAVVSSRRSGKPRRTPWSPACAYACSGGWGRRAIRARGAAGQRDVSCHPPPSPPPLQTTLRTKPSAAPPTKHLSQNQRPRAVPSRGALTGCCHNDPPARLLDGSLDPHPMTREVTPRRGRVHGGRWRRLCLGSRLSCSGRASGSPSDGGPATA